MKQLYPEIEPYSSRHLDVDSLHSLYIEQCGNPDGLPVLYLHGGPASGCKPDHRCFFDPGRYRIILFDQRGCGRSRPYGELTDNTTRHLIDDIEQIRQHLNIEQWGLFGGSWGATLALLYAQRYPDTVSAMILRGSFLARDSDLHWYAESGANWIYPGAWHKFMTLIDHQGASAEVIPVFLNLLFNGNPQQQLNAALGWSIWGAQVALGNAFDLSAFQEEGKQQDQNQMLKQVKIEAHYAKHRYFVDNNQILQNCSVIAQIPATIIHGQQDLVCPLEAAWSLKNALPQAKYLCLPNSGHIAKGDEMIDALVHTTDCVAEQLLVKTND